MHLAIYKCIKQKAEGKIYINYDCIREILKRRLYPFPRALHYVFLKELEELNLIKRNGNSKNIVYELTGGNKDKIINRYVDII